MLKTLKKGYKKHTQLELVNLLNESHPSQTKEIKKIVRLLRTRALQFCNDTETEIIRKAELELAKKCVLMADQLVDGENKNIKLFVELYKLACFLYIPMAKDFYRHMENTIDSEDKGLMKDAIGLVVRWCVGGVFVCSKSERKSLIHVLKLITSEYHDIENHDILKKAGGKMKRVPVPIITNNYGMGSGSTPYNKIWEDLGSREPVDMVAISVTRLGGNK